MSVEDPKHLESIEHYDPRAQIDRLATKQEKDILQDPTTLEAAMLAFVILAQSDHHDKRKLKLERAESNTDVLRNRYTELVSEITPDMVTEGIYPQGLVDLAGEIENQSADLERLQAPIEEDPYNFALSSWRNHLATLHEETGGGTRIDQEFLENMQVITELRKELTPKETVGLVSGAMLHAIGRGELPSSIQELKDVDEEVPTTKPTDVYTAPPDEPAHEPEEERESLFESWADFFQTDKDGVKKLQSPYLGDIKHVLDHMEEKENEQIVSGVTTEETTKRDFSDERLKSLKGRWRMKQALGKMHVLLSAGDLRGAFTNGEVARRARILTVVHRLETGAFKPHSEFTEIAEAIPTDTQKYPDDRCVHDIVKPEKKGVKQEPDSTTVRVTTILPIEFTPEVKVPVEVPVEPESLDKFPTTDDGQIRLLVEVMSQIDTDIASHSQSLESATDIKWPMGPNGWNSHFPDHYNTTQLKKLAEVVPPTHEFGVSGGKQYHYEYSDVVGTYVAVRYSDEFLRGAKKNRKKIIPKMLKRHLRNALEEYQQQKDEDTNKQG